MTKFTMDYTGRQVDVLAFDGSTDFGAVMLQQTLAQPGQGGKITAGIQKLAQRFVLELLTIKGTICYDPDRGTNFMLEAQTGQLNTQLDVYGAFARAVDQIGINLVGDEVASDPLDERFDSATIDSIAVEPGVAHIYVTLNSRAANSRSVLIPITLSL